MEDQPRDYSRLFPTYEQIFSPRAASPLSEFEHRVSPFDPNMSSAARYSPTPVQLPSSPFHNSVVVLQGPSSPLISQPEPNIRTSINYVTQLAHPIDTQAVTQTDASTDFVGNGNEEGLVSSVSSELILMQGKKCDFFAIRSIGCIKETRLFNEYLLSSGQFSKFTNISQSEAVITRQSVSHRKYAMLCNI